MIFKSPFLIASSMLVFAANSAGADAVSLQSRDGLFSVEGTYVEFADDHYVVATTIGTLRFKADDVDCFGEICPQFDFESADIRALVADQHELELTLELFRAFAADRGATPRVFNLPSRAETFADAVGEDGKIVRLAIMRSPATQSPNLLATRDADIAFSHRSEANAQISSSVLALEGLFAVADPQNPVSAISFDQMRSVFGGELKNWNAPDGLDPQVVPVSTAVQSFASRDLGADIQTAPDTGALTFVAADEVGASQVVQLLDSCQAPAAPDGFAVKSGEYPFARPVFVHQSKAPVSRAVNNFVSFALSAKGADILATAGLIHSHPETASMQPDGPRAQMLASVEGPRDKVDAARNMFDVMVEYLRLSTTFRFPTGSFDTDHLKQAELSALAEHLSNLPSGTRVVFAGFTDDVGIFERNQPLSETRAVAVVSAVSQLADGKLDALSIETFGFGELAPVACNSDDTGRGMNRRVEIWIGGLQDDTYRTVSNM